MLITLLGVVGAGLILIAYILGQSQKWKNTDLKYDITNAVGSILLVIYGVLINGWPFVALNSIWAIVSIKDIFLSLNRKPRQ